MREGRAILTLLCAGALGVTCAAASSASATRAPVGVPATGAPAAAAEPHQPVGTNELVGLRTGDTTPPRRKSVTPATSADGRYVAFASRSRLVDGAGPTHGRTHIYLRDRVTGITSAVDLSAAGKLGRGDAGSPSISPDGRFVAFNSSARNLSHNDSYYGSDCFVRDTASGTMTLLSVAFDGGPSSGSCYAPAISADGGSAAFWSDAPDLLPDGQGNGRAHVYRRDIATATTSLVSKSPTGHWGNGPSFSPAVSADGQRIVYRTYADNIDPLGVDSGAILYDVASDTSVLLYAYGDDPTISADGGTVAYIGYTYTDAGLVSDRFYEVRSYDVETQETTIVNRAADGGWANGDSADPSLSADGSWVSFSSQATNLVAGRDSDDWDVFVIDPSGSTTMVSRDISGGPANGPSGAPSLADDGSVVTYESKASDLVAETATKHQRVYSYRIS